MFLLPNPPKIIDVCAKITASYFRFFTYFLFQISYSYTDIFRFLQIPNFLFIFAKFNLLLVVKQMLFIRGLETEFCILIYYFNKWSTFQILYFDINWIMCYEICISCNYIHKSHILIEEGTLINKGKKQDDQYSNNLLELPILRKYLI